MCCYPRLKTSLLEYNFISPFLLLRLPRGVGVTVVGIEGDLDEARVLFLYDAPQKLSRTLATQAMRFNWFISNMSTDNGNQTCQNERHRPSAKRGRRWFVLVNSWWCRNGMTLDARTKIGGSRPYLRFLWIFVKIFIKSKTPWRGPLLRYLNPLKCILGHV